MNRYESSLSEISSTDDGWSRTSETYWEARQYTLQEIRDQTENVQCRICGKLLQMALEVSNPVGQRSYTIGTQEEISNRSTCQNHQSFLEHVASNCFGKRTHLSTFTMSFAVTDGGIKAVVHDARGLKYYRDYDSLKKQRSILISNSREDMPCNPTERMLSYGDIYIWSRVRHPDFIDTDLLKLWKADCEDKYGKVSAKISPSWLIDVEKMCLVPGGGRKKSYVALSYVWGKVAMLKATIANILALQQEGAFTRLSDTIPTTIQHAMKTVGILDERYLWVDSLCIIQDDKAHLQHQLRRMALIYQSASLTLIAANGDDANCGIHGLQGISEPRILPPSLKLTEEVSITLSSDPLALRESVWSQRGWTLQEQLFSTRKLIFVDNTVWWTDGAREYAQEGFIHMLLAEPLGFSDCPTPTDFLYEHPRQNNLDAIFDGYSPVGLETLEIFINIFNRRDLSFDTDAIPASLSVLYTLRPHFPRGFLYGHPVSFLDATLIWRSNPRRPFRRRSSAADNPVPPTWSWAGWQGELTPTWSTHHLHDVDMSRVPRACNAGTIPFLRWSLQMSRHTRGDWIPFQNGSYDYKVRYFGKVVGSLPEGWSHHQALDCSRWVAEEAKKHCKNHKKVDVDAAYDYMFDAYPSSVFLYPIPLGGKLRPAPGGFDTVPSSGRYLCANTSQLRLWARKPTYEYTIVPNPSSYERGDIESDEIRQEIGPTESKEDTELNSDTGEEMAKEAKSKEWWERAAASLRWQDSHSYDPHLKFEVCGNSISVQECQVVLNDGSGKAVGVLFPNMADDIDKIWGTGSQGSQGTPVDLVAISRGHTVDLPQIIHPGDWNFYHVLWVEWMDGIAYRKGVGQVFRSAWERLGAKNVYLVLG